jgi:predicted lipoprotein with Yx(FWY)xxD motif
VLAACGSSAVAPKTDKAQTARAVASTSVAVRPQPRPAPILLRTDTSRYGRVLMDHRGYALYLFTHDTGADSTCAGACARAWPPYLVSGRGRGIAGAHSSLIGLTRRRDGGRQLTYAGHPLYYYVGDRSPGQILCQGAVAYGGHWWVVSAAGAPVTSG